MTAELLLIPSKLIGFYPRDAMLAQYLPSSCVCLSQVGVLLRPLNLGSCKQRHTIAQVTMEG